MPDTFDFEMAKGRRRARKEIHRASRFWRETRRFDNFLGASEIARSSGIVQFHLRAAGKE